MRLILAFCAASLIAAAADEPLLLQKPTLSKTHIVFAYAGDLWNVPRDGGDATRLTSGAGIETDPAFSPDGTRVDVFVIPAAGGVPKRLTWHPSADIVLGWTPDGKRIIFSSTRFSYSRFAELFTIPAEGGVEEKLPLPSGYQASLSPDGESIAYEPTGKAFTMWKRYRPQRPGHPLLVRREVEKREGGHPQSGAGPEVRNPGPGRDRLRTVRRHFHVRSEIRQGQTRLHTGAGRHAGTAFETSRRWPAPRDARGFTHRRTRRLHRPR